MNQFMNQWRQVLTGPVAPSALSIPVSDVSALSFPRPTDRYRLTLIKSGTNQFELMEATGKTGNSLTVTRGVEGTLPLSFVAGDTIEMRISAGLAQAWERTTEGLSLGVNFDIQASLAKSVVSLATDLTAANSQKLLAVGAAKDYVDQSSPVGMITAWNPGYFTNGANGGFTAVLSVNNIAAANAYLNPKGWYVCDGATLNLRNSPIFNGAGRHLPNLTDDRFLSGTTLAGLAGGNNSPGHTHTVPTHVHGMLAHGHSIPNHAHYINLSVGGGNHHHGQTLIWQGGVNGNNAVPAGQMGTISGGASSNGYATWLAASAHSHAVVGWAGSGTDAASNTLGTGSTAASNTLGAGSGNTGGTNVDNRPKYLTCFYIIKVL